MRIITKICLLIFMVVLSFDATAQFKRKKKAAAVTADTTKKVVKPKVNPLKKIKPYAAIISKNYTSKKGLFHVHQNKDSVYFEIPNSLLDRDVLVSTRLKRTPSIVSVFPNEELSNLLIQFTKGPDSSIRIVFNQIYTEADSADMISKAVATSSMKPIVATFPIAAYATDSTSSVIDMTKFLKEVNFINAFPHSLSKSMSIATIINPRVESVRVYPENVELSISKTFNRAEPEVPAGQKALTFETNSSFILLPKVPMQRRYFDKRVGYFARYFFQYSDSQHETEMKGFIARWRLEPKDEDVEKYKQGVLVEPKKPIVIYIDPATPSKWVPFLIAGINDWQKSFEKAGFKNAIIGKEWPVNDTTMHMDDIRHSMINYFPSSTANAYGPHLADPRSGEIIQTRIGWYHNIMDVLYRWYVVQAGATDPSARKPKLDDKLMGELIRFVSSHEVGHTLGLRHNFGSSSKTPVEKLRDVTYLKKHGHTPSIMDYARFNYVAQPEDNIPQELLFPRIGEYDDWAIEWGYKNTFLPTAEKDAEVVKKWIVDRVKANPRLWFGDGEGKNGDPRNQIEDLGDNSMKASAYGIKNLKRIVPNISKWTFEKGNDYKKTAKIYSAVINQYYMYLNHVLNNVGGIYRTYNSEGESIQTFTATPKARQLEAIAFLDRELFTTPKWLLNFKILDKVMDPVVDMKEKFVAENFVEDMQVKSLNLLLDQKMLSLISANHERFGKDTYSVNDHLKAVRNSIWKTIQQPAVNTDLYQRNLQRTYIGALIAIIAIATPVIADNEVSTIAAVELQQVRSQIKTALPRASNVVVKQHLLHSLERISRALDPKK